MQFNVKTIFPTKISLRFYPDKGRAKVSADFVFVDENNKEIQELGVSRESFDLDFNTIMQHGGQNLVDQVKPLIKNRRLGG